MYKLVICVLVLFSSCSKHAFISYYNQEKNNTDIAVAFPKYLAVLAVPRDAKEEVKYFTKGMKKIRVLFDNEPDKAKSKRFKSFLASNNYEPYIVIKEDGSEFNLYSIEDDQNIREIILDIHSRDESIIVALLGKMDKATFKAALDEASRAN